MEWSDSAPLLTGTASHYRKGRLAKNFPVPRRKSTALRIVLLMFVSVVHVSSFLCLITVCSPSESPVNLLHDCQL